MFFRTIAALLSMGVPLAAAPRLRDTDVTLETLAGSAWVIEWDGPDKSSRIEFDRGGNFTSETTDGAGNRGRLAGTVSVTREKNKFWIGSSFFTHDPDAMPPVSVADIYDWEFTGGPTVFWVTATLYLDGRLTNVKCRMKIRKMTHGVGTGGIR